jgi:hypothetical protein
MTFSFTPYPPEQGRSPSCWVAINFVGFEPNASGTYYVAGNFQGFEFTPASNQFVTLDANGSGVGTSTLIIAKTTYLTGELLGVAATPAVVNC